MSGAEAARAAEYIPVSLKISAEGGEAWGRLTSVTPERLVLLTRFRLRPGAPLLADFELAGRGFREVRCRVAAAASDADGYWNCELSVTAPDARRELAEAVLSAMCAAPSRPRAR